MSDQFPSVKAALIFAYRNIDRNLMKISSPQRGINCTNKSDLSPLDLITQAVFIISSLKDLPDVQRDVIRLHYAKDDLDPISKNLGFIAHSETGYSYKFCIDSCLSWSDHGRMKMKQGYKGWEEKTGKDRTTIWRRANRIKKDILDMYEDQAVRQLRSIMEEKGIIACNATTIC